MKKKIVELAKEILLKKNENPSYDIHFMCLAIEKAAYVLGYVKDDSKLKGFEIIPEMLKYKPDGIPDCIAWFNIDEKGMNQRLEILDKLIKELNN